MVCELTVLCELLAALGAHEGSMSTVRVGRDNANSCTHLSSRWIFWCRASSLRFLNAFSQTAHSCAPLGWSWSMPISSMLGPEEESGSNARALVSELAASLRIQVLVKVVV